MASLVAGYDSGSDAAGATPAHANPREEGEEGEAYDPFSAAGADDQGGGADAYDPLEAARGGDDDAGKRRGEDEPPAKRARTAPPAAPPGELPPPPSEKADPELVGRLLGFVERGVNPTEQIRANREFHNPMLLEKIARRPSGLLGRKTVSRKTRRDAAAPPRVDARKRRRSV